MSLALFHYIYLSIPVIFMSFIGTATGSNVHVFFVLYLQFAMLSDQSIIDLSTCID